MVLSMKRSQTYSFDILFSTKYLPGTLKFEFLGAICKLLFRKTIILERNLLLAITKQLIVRSNSYLSVASCLTAHPREQATKYK